MRCTLLCSVMLCSALMRCVQVSIVHANVLDVDISPASAIFVYLVPEGMRAMRDRLLEAMDQRGVRVVTYGACLCMYACMYVCMCVCMHVCMYVCMCVCMYACMCVCVYVCVCACLCVQLCGEREREREREACSLSECHVCGRAWIRIRIYLHTYNQVGYNSFFIVVRGGVDSGSVFDP